jgi:hypothetical protein
MILISVETVLSSVRMVLIDAGTILSSVGMTLITVGTASTGPGMTSIDVAKNGPGQFFPCGETGLFSPTASKNVRRTQLPFIIKNL